MDDFVVFGRDKGELRSVLQEITTELEKVKLTVNPKTAIYNITSAAGVPFLGYRYHVDRRGRLEVTPLSATVRRVRRRLGTLRLHNPEKYERSYESYRGYFMHSMPETKMEEVVGEKVSVG